MSRSDPDYTSMYERFVESVSTEDFEDYADFQSMFFDWLNVSPPTDRDKAEDFVLKQRTLQSYELAGHEVWNRHIAPSLDKKRVHKVQVTWGSRKPQVLAMPYRQRKRYATYIKSYMRGKSKIKAHWRLKPTSGSKSE